MEDLTDSDIESLYYFITEKDDVTRWCDWEKKREAVKARFPELVFAIEQREIGAKLLRRVIRDIYDHDRD